MSSAKKSGGVLDALTNLAFHKSFKECNINGAGLKSPLKVTPA
jgi:hypothetical protein